MAADDRANLLLEIGCEELPPRAIDALREALFDAVADGVEKAGLPFDRANSRSFSTPRRLALRLCDVAERQPDQVVERRGPAVQAAFDEDGKPTAAARGFAQSVGMEPDALATLKTDKGEWLYCKQNIEGKPLSALIFDIIETALKQLPIPRPMRWSDNDFSFVRPVHWVVLLHGEQLIAGEVLGQPTACSTRGHRIHDPGPHDLASPDQYEQVLMDARVMVDPDSRAERIVEALQKADHNVIIEQDLLREVTNLVEWPIVVSCTFDEEFLQIPHEALVASMQDHQKFFPVRAEDKSTSGAAISNRFLAVSNVESTNTAVVQKGFERVIRPRLADARFFFEQDKKAPLESYSDLLDRVVFQEKIGTVGDKTRRICVVSEKISDFLRQDPAPAQRAGQLCKCDLMTQMVGEFPELQGVMGEHYAAASGEPDSVSRAIGEHYSPRFAGDDIPHTQTGRTIAIADKVDTLVAIFSAGLKPSGNKDPYALRRAALGLVRILAEAKIPLALHDLLSWAGEALRENAVCEEETLAEVRDFILQRGRAYYREQGLQTTLINAAIASSWSHWPDLHARIAALQTFVGREEAQSLAAANKRIGNILRKAEQATAGTVDESLLTLDEERVLFDVIKGISREIEPFMAESDYTSALDKLATLREPVDHFFDTVLVMDEDPKVRTNRLAILNQLKSLFDDIADLSVLA